jgi:anti-sigma regulatory factor (Ser/Thr protein kinase)
MALNTMMCIHIGGMSGVVEARQRAIRICETRGPGAALSNILAVIVTELATNIVKHAGQGDLLIRTCNETEVCAIECLALDQGPGIRDVGLTLKDGNPTGAGPENGLRTVRSLSSVFDVYTRPGIGTAVLARIEKERSVQAADPQHQPGPFRCETGVVCLPLEPDTPCGDGWDVIRLPDRTVILVIDGLGHGPEAAKVPEEAIRCIRKNPAGEPAEILWTLHDALRSTRGGVAAVAVIDDMKGRITYAGAGNISGRIITGPDTHKMVSLSGTVGYEIRKIREFSHSFESGALLVMYSDGLFMRWDMEDYPGLRQKHPSLIAGVLYRDHTRGTDDVTVLAVKLVVVII